MANVMRISVVLALSVLFLAGAVVGQDLVFSDPNVEYSFSLPDAKWKMVGAKPSSPGAGVEFVYGDRMDGHLEVRRIAVTKDTILTDLIQDEEQRLQFRKGYVAGREENFTGKLRGAIFNFEYVATGRTMAGRFYFLRASDNVVYALRFSGQKDSMRSIRNQVDMVARTFGVK